MSGASDRREAAAARHLSSAASDGARVSLLQRSAALRPGSVVGRYVVIEWVGEGASGVVYAAYDPELDRKVALNVMHPSAVPGDGERGVQKKMLREARAMARLTHPNVVSVHDAGSLDGHLFLAMEFVDGATLRTWLARNERSHREILAVLLDAGRGLAAAHAAGLVHRDFKPENVLIGKDGRARVTDFGLASMHGQAERAIVSPAAGGALFHPASRSMQSTWTGVVAGTPAYMAPEQQEGRPADARSDQFSFCVTLYEALYGERPTTAAAAGPRPNGGRSEGTAAAGSRPVPARIREILARGLRASPDERYPTMNHLVAELGRDPGRRWGRAVAVVVTVLSVTGAAAGYRAWAAHSAVETCAGGRQSLGEIWDGTTKDAIARAFRATGKPYAEDAWLGTERALDAFAHDWLAARRDACEATHVRKAQSPELLDLRMACFDDRKRELAGLTRVLTRADADVVAHALAASQSLTPLAPCSDGNLVRSRINGPVDAESKARALAVRARIADLKALDDTGSYKVARPLVADVVTAARSTNDSRVLAEALYQGGLIDGDSGDAEAAAARLLEAGDVADASGDDRTRAMAWSQLVYFVAYVQGKHELLPLFRDQAAAALRRLGGDEEIEAQVANNAGSTLLDEQRYDEAADALARSLALREKLHGKEDRQVGVSHMNLASACLLRGRIDEAQNHFEKALSILEQALGPNHEVVAAANSNLGALYEHKLDLEKAQAYDERAVAIADAALGPEHPDLANYLDNLGEVFVERGDSRRAIALHLRALAMREKLLPPMHPGFGQSLRGVGKAYVAVGEPKKAIGYLERALALPAFREPTNRAEVEFALAQAVIATDRSRAMALAREALETYRRNESTATPAVALERAHVEAWLDAHHHDARAGS